MTWLLDSTRRTDRAAQPQRHVGPYYGYALKRVVDPSTEASIIDRIADDGGERPTVVLLKLGAVFMVATIGLIVWFVVWP